MRTSIFTGCVPALMTPCDEHRKTQLRRACRKGFVSYRARNVCRGLLWIHGRLAPADRFSADGGVSALVEAGVPVIVGTGAINSESAVAHAAHAQRVGAQGLMVIPRVLSRGNSLEAQRYHFKAILEAAADLPAVIYNSPYYGFTTRADLFFALRSEHPNLVGFKEFGGFGDLRYASEHITSKDPDVTLMIGVDTAVYHGFVNCGAGGQLLGSETFCPRRSSFWLSCLRKRLREMRLLVGERENLMRLCLCSRVLMRAWI